MHLDKMRYCTSHCTLQNNCCLIDCFTEVDLRSVLHESTGVYTNNLSSVQRN